MRDVIRRAVLLVAVGWLSGSAGAAGLPDEVDRNRDGEILIGCLGDSNTTAGWQYVEPTGFPPDRGWCEQLVAGLDDPRIRLVNLAAGGASVCPNDIGGVAEMRIYFSGPGQVDALLTTEPVDIVFLAYGTNDVLPERSGIPRKIVDCYNAVWRRVRQHDLLAFIPITPPALHYRRPGKYRRDLALIAELNERIVETFDPHYLLDFHANMTPDDFMDDLHMNENGQTKRAEEARRRLIALAEVTPPPAGVRAVRWSRGQWSRPKQGDPSALIAGN